MGCGCSAYDENERLSQEELIEDLKYYDYPISEIYARAKDEYPDDKEERRGLIRKAMHMAGPKGYIPEPPKQEEVIALLETAQVKAEQPEPTVYTKDLDLLRNHNAEERARVLERVRQQFFS